MSNYRMDAFENRLSAACGDIRERMEPVLRAAILDEGQAKAAIQVANNALYQHFYETATAISKSLDIRKEVHDFYQNRTGRLLTVIDSTVELERAEATKDCMRRAVWYAHERHIKKFVALK
jgi:hypothetical protein